MEPMADKACLQIGTKDQDGKVMYFIHDESRRRFGLKESRPVDRYEISQHDRALRSQKTNCPAESTKDMQIAACTASVCARRDESTGHPELIVFCDSREFGQTANGFLRQIAGVLASRQTPETEIVFGFRDAYSAKQRSKLTADFEAVFNFTFLQECCRTKDSHPASAVKANRRNAQYRMASTSRHVPAPSSNRAGP
jgi:hypothetical protein